MTEMFQMRFNETKISFSRVKKIMVQTLKHSKPSKSLRFGLSLYVKVINEFYSVEI